MCIANHPVLYDLHMQALERSCARVSAQARPVVDAPYERRQPQESDWGFAQPGYAVLIKGLARALQGKGFRTQGA